MMVSAVCSMPCKKLQKYQKINAKRGLTKSGKKWYTETRFKEICVQNCMT